MKSVNLTHFRQGDVYLERIDTMNTEGYTKRKPSNNRLVLAYGEVTGHHHSINLLETSDVELYENKDGDMLLKINTEAVVEHQEHSAITIAPGKYEVYIQEEYDPEGMKRVQD